MASLEERVQALRDKRVASTAPKVSMEDRVAAIRARRAAPPVEAAPVGVTHEGVTPVAPVEAAPSGLKARLAQSAPKAPVDPDSFSSTIGRSVDNMQASLGGAMEAVGQITDSQYLQDEGDEYRKEQKAEAAQYGRPSIESFRDVDFGNPDQVGTYLKQMGLGTVPGLATGIVGSVTGSKVGGAVGGTRGAVAGGIFGALLSALPVNVGEIQNAMKEIDPEAKSPWSAVLGGAAMSTLDIVGLTSIAKPLIKHFGKDIVYRGLLEQGVVKEMALGAVKGTLIGAPTEAIQEAVSAYSAADGTDTKVNTEDLMYRMIDGAVGGSLGGGAAHGVTSGLGAMGNNSMVAGTATEGPSFSEGRTKPANMAQRAWDAMGSSSTALLKPLARVSPEIESIVRKLRPDMTGETASVATVFEDADLMVGKWETKLKDGLNGHDVDQALSDYLDGNDTPGAKAFKDTLEDALDTAKNEGGLDIGQIPTYLPTTLDPVKVNERLDEFKADIAPYVVDVDKAVDEWTLKATANRGNSIPQVNKGVQLDMNGNWVADKRYQHKGDPESFKHKFAQGYIPPEYGHLEAARSFGKVPQKILQKYTKEQTSGEILKATRDYFEGAAHRIAFAKAFGPQGEKLNFQIAKGVKEAQSKGYTPTKQEIDHIYGIVDAYNGMYGRIQTEGLKKVISGLSTIATIKALPLTLLSSLVEVATPAIRGDIKSALLEVAPTIAQLSRNSVRHVMKSVPRNEHAKFASEANLTLSAALNTASERLGTSAIGRKGATALKWYFLANGVTLWTHATGVYAARVGDRIYKDNLQKLASGLPVTSAKGAQMANQLRSMGVPVYTNQDAENLYNPQSQAMRETSDAARRLAMRRFKDQTVLHPNIADVPLWMSNGHLQMFAILGRYPAAFGNTILPQIARRFSPSWAGSRTSAFQGFVGSMFILSFMLGVGAMQDEFKQIAKSGEVDYEDKRTETQRFVDILNTTVTPLQVSKALDFVSAPRYGKSGADSIAGPLVGMAVDITKLAANPSEGAIWKYLYNQTPAQFYKPGREAASEIDVFDFDD